MAQNTLKNEEWNCFIVFCQHDADITSYFMFLFKKIFRMITNSLEIIEVYNALEQ